MRITHVNTYDVSGGAARAAYRLHQGLQKIGHESRMFVLDKRSRDPNITLYEPAKDLWSRIKRTIRQRSLGNAIRKYLPGAPPEVAYFSNDRTPLDGEPWEHLPDCDVVQLHWTFGFLDYRAFFSSLKAGTPVVWTLHAMDAMTGGCLYDGGCGRFTSSCGACPLLGSKSDEDLSREVWRRKRAIYSTWGRGRLRFVAPSRWMRDELGRSSLLGEFPCSVIPNAVDTEVFTPRNREASREVAGVPRDAHVVLCVADGLNDPRKGLDLLFAALAGVKTEKELVLVSLGPGRAVGLDGIKNVHIDALNNDRFLSFVYSAADLLVVPSLQDNLPNTILESIACGTPVVGFSVGGIPDVVRPGSTGGLAKGGDALDLRRAIGATLADEGKLRDMGAECRRIAVAEYTLEVQASRYAALYRESLEGRAE